MVELDGLGPHGEDAYLVRCDDLRANDIALDDLVVRPTYGLDVHVSASSGRHRIASNNTICPGVLFDMTN